MYSLFKALEKKKHILKWKGALIGGLSGNISAILKVAGMLIKKSTVSVKPLGEPLKWSQNHMEWDIVLSLE